MYLVKECVTMSAPRLRGLQFTGDENVLSTQRRAPWALQAYATFSMSKILRVGFVGVSIHTILVLGLRCFLNSEMTLKSTKDTSMSALGLRIVRRYLAVPPYTSSTHRTWSPREQRFIRVTLEDMPEFVAKAKLAYSRVASCLSRASLVGLPQRA